ncbi:MAG TPA: FtsW/RodA/SpoVE family cell cycle protein [Candidatus Merdicola faecigallinarum]|uniref:Probable peptidoglycan glycosyltransferase FtsW n=1 Tax=Candidatus Merdicola faecigallinarum TaxID=2840862 RepID=A0A9D1M0D3_9FIRM|nr:FtsW/RodA/SpoVE family cell cycle protein [Candidatus Merdicola faecigallinarum]
MAKKVRKVSNFANKQFDFILLITVMILLALGLIMVLSASSPSSLSETGDDSYVYFRKQSGSALLGIAAMLFLSKVDYRFYKKFYKIAYIGSIILLLMVLIPKVGVEAGGARRWINLGIQFQPSEIAKIGMIIFFASYLSDHRKELNGIKNGFFKPFLILAPVIFILLFIQDHLSASVVMILIVSVMMIIAGCKLTYFLTVGTVGVGVGAARIICTC